MEKFPDWAADALKDAKPPVTHGLNLALQLKNPEQLPLMLWDIMAARPQVQQALEDLSFLHYARFVPSYDGTALMVITEFDGPLEPYVMDFVIALGDVFDVLLSYAKGAPPLPVREHPEEFLDFVRLWNRVPVYPTIDPLRRQDNPSLLPADFDFPVYAAYPERSVIDIVGPRQRLPPPALDRPARPVRVPLNDVQGNILQGFGAAAARHLFLRVDNAAQARVWLSTTLPDTAQAWGGLTTAERWTDKPSWMVNVALTYTGLQALLPGRREDHKRFPLAFRQGSHGRAEHVQDTGPHAPQHWVFGRDDQAIAVVLSIHTFARPDDAGDAATWVAFDAAAAALLASAQANGLRLVMDPLNALQPAHGRDHFGYRDGIANPRISGQCPMTGDADFQPAASPGEFLLGPYPDIYGGPSIGKMPEDLALNGCFAAMRLLEQKTDLLEQTVQQHASALGMSPAALKARLMGRRENGTPLSLGEDPGGAGEPRNDFDYAPSWEHMEVVDDHAGAMCPVGAHIRRTNPRNALVIGARHSRRLLRRGMPIEWSSGAHATSKGLLGLFLCGSLERQFEFIQREWIQGGLAASGQHRKRQDPIAGLRETDTEFEVLPGRTINVPPLVYTRGSLYLLFPGIKALKGLAHPPASTEEAIAAAADAAKTLADAGQSTQGVVQTAAAGIGNVIEGFGQAAGMVLPSPLDTSAATAASGAAAASASAINASTEVLAQATHATTEVTKVAILQATELAKNMKEEALGGVTHSEFVQAWKAQALLWDAEQRRDWVGAFTEDAWNDAWAAISGALRLTQPINTLLDHLALMLIESPSFRFVLDRFGLLAKPVVPTLADGFPQLTGTQDARFMANPSYAFKSLRAAGHRMVWVPEHKAFWVLDRDLVKEVFQAPQRFVQQPGDGTDRGIITADGERQKVIRKAVESAMVFMTPPAKNRPNLLVSERVAEEVAAALKAIGDLPQFDLVTQYTNRVPGQVFWRLFGVDNPSQRRACDALARTMMRHFGQPDSPGSGDRLALGNAAIRLTRHMALLLAKAMLDSMLVYEARTFKKTLIGEIAARTHLLPLLQEDRPLTFIESLLTLVQFVLAGYLAMQFVAGTTVRNLLMPDPRPGQSSKLPWKQIGELPAAEQEDALRLALDESRRVDPAVTIVQRFAAKGGVKLNGIHIPEDCAVHAVVVSANRDQLDQAESFIWNRPTPAFDPSHFSLGCGLHECVGKALQNWVLPNTLLPLLQKMPDLRLSYPDATPAWLNNVYFRALTSLPVVRC